MAGNRKVKRAKATALFTGLGVAAACVYVAVAYYCVSATGYEVFAAGYGEVLLIEKKQLSQLQCGISL